ncbi:hypothetical protein SAMN02799631_06448 [Methylobacterium sp. 174MFSha1.1]|nr:hypothetical protein SAMN02799631_06448 [Methylobacterium sp. 174MFSha1.1]
MDTTTLLAFAAAFLVFAASPGPDNMTIVARTLSHGPAAGLAYGFGMVGASSPSWSSPPAGSRSWRGRWGR